MTTKKRAPKIDAYQRVTDSILALIDQGVSPWRKTWKGASSTHAPISMSSGKEYGGINPWILQMTGMAAGYTSRHWGTFKAAKANGGSVRKGEKATTVVFWKWLPIKDKVTGEPAVIPFLRHFSVFNADQIDWVDGLPEKFAPVEDGEGEGVEFDPIEAAEKIASGYLEGGKGPAFANDGGDRAFYRPLADKVSMPERAAFEGAQEYYTTLFHELGHSTGHESRLKRKGITDYKGFGSHEYSQEELVAEFTACFLNEDCGLIDTRENSAAYLKGWSTALKGNKKLVVMAATQAAKAARMILNQGEKDAPFKKEEAAA